MDLIKKVKQNIKKYKLFGLKERVILAVSGGIDSVVLLDVIKNLQLTTTYNLQPVVAHLNHGLRGKDSDLDQKFVKELAKKYELKFETKKIDVKKLSRAKKRNLEEVAREERYKFLAFVAQKYKTDKIVTAHQADDQVETVLLNYIRGAGPHGLSGMDYITKLKFKNEKLKIIRPMLNIWRTEILEYQKENSLIFRQDKSNFNLKITRNFLRLKIIPNLEKQDKNFKKNIWEEARRLKEIITFLEPKITKIYEDVKEKETPHAVVLDIFKFKKLGDNLKAEILRRAVEFLLWDLKNVSEKHIIDSLKAVKAGKVGKIVVMPRQLRVIIDYDSVIVLKGTLPKLKVKSKKLKVGNNRIAECGLNISLKIGNKTDKSAFNYDFSKVKLPIYADSALAGDRFKPRDFQGTKKLQDLFVDLKVPQRLRSLIPVIRDRNGKILGVLGIRQGQEALVDKDTRKVLTIRFEKLK